MGKTRPEITQQKAAWEKEWSSIATPKMMEALALLDALPDPQFTRRRKAAVIHVSGFSASWSL